MSFERPHSIESHERIKLILIFGDKTYFWRQNLLLHGGSHMTKFVGTPKFFPGYSHEHTCRLLNSNTLRDSYIMLLRYLSTSSSIYLNWHISVC